MIASDHLHSDAGGVTLCNGLNRFGARRVDQTNQADQRQMSVQVSDVQAGDLTARTVTPLRSRAGPRPLGRPTIECQYSAVERLVAAIDCALIAAQRQHRLGRTFNVNAGMAFEVMMQHGHVAMRRVERDCVGAGQAGEGGGALAR